MYREDGWLAKMAAYSPSVVIGACVMSVIGESFSSTGHQNFTGALKGLFFAMVDRTTIATVLLATMLYMIGFLLIDGELRSAPKFRHAAIGNSIVILFAVTALWLGVSSVWFWSAMFVAGVMTSIFFRRRY